MRRSPYSEPAFPSHSRGEEVVHCLTLLLVVVTILLWVGPGPIGISPSQLGSESGRLSLGTAPPPSNTPLFMVESGPDARYLRGAVGIVYDGEEWRLERIEGEYLEFVVYGGDGDLLLRPSEVARSHQDFPRDRLNEALVIDDARCLKLPENISERVRELSLGITEDFATPFEKARAIEIYLRLHYTYDADFAPAPSDREPNDWFLFESKEGVCGNFASAFVILARASGLPSRLGAGYFVAPGEGEQAVYESQAHGWAEVGFEGSGWVVFDAT
ncbi:MAG: transglutaminase domain-containing protein [Chloroflexi bacterium]|nr:transglutaminase domain-containing protein [Chloroflexota bacterium]